MKSVLLAQSYNELGYTDLIGNGEQALSSRRLCECRKSKTSHPFDLTFIQVDADAAEMKLMCYQPLAILLTTALVKVY